MGFVDFGFRTPTPTAFGRSTGTSAMRYWTTEGHQVVQQGNRRYVMLDGPPPIRKTEPQPIARRHHWLAIFGTGMLVMILVFIAINEIGSAWQAHQLDATYGMPRTFQTDAVVGHNNDSAANPSHFIFENYHGKVFIIEWPAGDISKTIAYAGPPIVGQDADSVPVTSSFADVNGDGRPDMVVQIENQRFVYLNNGSKFVSQ